MYANWFSDEFSIFYSFPGSTPLHLAARSGSLDCIRELLAWGADRLQRDASGYFLMLLNSLTVVNRCVLITESCATTLNQLHAFHWIRVSCLK